MSLEQALTSNHLIIGELESEQAKQQLYACRASNDVLAKWQAANAVLVHATLRVLPQVGFTADGAGLQAYSESFAACVQSSPPEARATLRTTNDAKWQVLLREAFECAPAPPLTLTQARALAIDLVDALQDEALLKQVEETRTGLAARLPEQERQHMVARALVDVQLGVAARHGYEGATGYAQAQVCLMEHASDAVVTASVAAATTAIYARAGINLQEALRQLGGS